MNYKEYFCGCNDVGIVSLISSYSKKYPEENTSVERVSEPESRGNVNALGDDENHNTKHCFINVHIGLV
jgi:hypothetical protein